jgi:hypothetical protein
MPRKRKNVQKPSKRAAAAHRPLVLYVHGIGDQPSVRTPLRVNGSLVMSQKTRAEQTAVASWRPRIRTGR